MQLLGLHSRNKNPRNPFPTPTGKGSVLEYPSDSVEPSRNSRPVVLLHGTLVEKDGIAAYREYALRSGHPVNHRTYQSITKGGRIEASTELASQQVNLSRAEIAKGQVRTLKDLNREDLRQAVSLDGNLYGTPDPDVDLILDQTPFLLAEIGTLLEQPEEKIASSLSGQLKRLEHSFAGRLAESGMEEKKSRAVVRELVDTIAPRAIVVGHSAGGYVAYTMAVNPESEPDRDPYTFDGGNGVGEVIVLSAPIKSGLPSPPLPV